jgi:hypothetical protein
MPGGHKDVLLFCGFPVGPAADTGEGFGNTTDMTSTNRLTTNTTRFIITPENRNIFRNSHYLFEKIIPGGLTQFAKE